jgi:hypothetical protein
MAGSKTPLVARESFACEINGREVLIREGQQVSDPKITKGRESLFGLAEATRRPPQPDAKPDDHHTPEAPPVEAVDPRQV